MSVTKEQKESIVKRFRRHDLDSGSPEVQVSLLTARINEMTLHFNQHKKDFHGVRGLMKSVNQRRKLLDYFKRVSPQRYEELIKQLDLRK